jgi:hypothetical protein
MDATTGGSKNRELRFDGKVDGFGVIVLAPSASHCAIGLSYIGSTSSEDMELVLENDKLGGLEARLDDAAEDHLLSAVSAAEASDLVLISDNGRKNDTVRALLNAGLSASFSSSTTFLISGSLNSNFPSLSDAKYSSPRPKTTCNVAKSRVVPSVG